MHPLAGRRPAARRIAAALLERGGDALALGVRAVRGRGATAPAAGVPAAVAPAAVEPAPAVNPDAGEPPAAQPAAEEAAARLDAARDRLRATIAAPDDDEGPASPSPAT